MWRYGVWHHVLDYEMYGRVLTAPCCPVLAAPAPEATSPEELRLIGTVCWDDPVAPAIDLARSHLAPTALARIVWQGAAFTMRGCETFAGWRCERSCLVAVPGDPPVDGLVPLEGDLGALTRKLPTIEERLAADGEPLPPGHRLVRVTDWRPPFGSRA